MSRLSSVIFTNSVWLNVTYRVGCSSLWLRSQTTRFSLIWDGFTPNYLRSSNWSDRHKQLRDKVGFKRTFPNEVRWTGGRLSSLAFIGIQIIRHILQASYALSINGELSTAHFIPTQFARSGDRGRWQTTATLLLRIEGLYEVMWRVLGITEEEMCVEISLAFCRTFGAVGLLFMFKERYMFPLDLCLSSWTKSYSLTCIDVLNFHGVPFASCLGFSLERCYPAEWSSMVDVCGFNTPPQAESFNSFLLNMMRFLSRMNWSLGSGFVMFSFEGTYSYMRSFFFDLFSLPMELNIHMLWFAVWDGIFW